MGAFGFLGDRRHQGRLNLGSPNSSAATPRPCVQCWELHVQLVRAAGLCLALGPCLWSGWLSPFLSQAHPDPAALQLGHHLGLWGLWFSVRPWKAGCGGQLWGTCPGPHSSVGLRCTWQPSLSSGGWVASAFLRVYLQLSLSTRVDCPGDLLPRDLCQTKGSASSLL